MIYLTFDPLISSLDDRSQRTSHALPAKAKGGHKCIPTVTYLGG
jgi:hypothetical protein